MAALGSVTLLNAVTATGAGAAHRVRSVSGPATLVDGAVQAILTGTATAVLEGSLNGTNWAPLLSYGADGIDGCRLPPYIRGNVTARSSGAVTLLVLLPSGVAAEAV